MNLRNNTEVKIKAWYNENQITDDNWLIYSEDNEETFWIFMKDPSGTNQLKLKIEKSQESSSKS